MEDHTGDWARAREIRDGGCLMVRPDHHVAGASETVAADPAAELRRALQIPSRALRLLPCDAHEYGFFTEANSAEVVIGAQQERPAMSG